MCRSRTTAGLLAIAALTLAACGDDSDDGETTDDTAPADTTTLTIEELEFSEVTVDPGETVTVENRDDVSHTATAVDGSFDTGTIDGESSGSFVAPDEPGAHPVRCEFHPQMEATVTVAGG